jgi:pyrimidine operon attenuation protein/uracil phosphoribosyltransferase
MSDKKVLILNKQQIQQKITRMAYQIWEDNLEEPEVIIAGIIHSGYTLADRLAKELERISGIKDSSHLKATTDIPVESCADKVVVIADDVLNSGRTLAYGLGVYLNIPLKKLRTAVLVNRSHRVFPLSPDFTGLDLATVIKEHVDVVLTESEDAVYLR